MTPPGNPEPAKPASVESVLSDFESKKEMLVSLCAKTKTLIEESLADAQIQYQSVQARVKTKKKLKQKYSNQEKGYKGLDDITDLAALRIITYYEDEVDAVAEIIKREFEVDPENSVDRRNIEPDRFSYHAINYVVRHTPQRLGSVEYKRFLGLRYEIQVTSILSHAWAEIEHDWYDLRDAFPPEIKRRFARMAALLEVAESEFLELRKRRSAYERSIAVQVEAKVPGVTLDALSLKPFLEQDALVAQLDSAIARLRGWPVAPSTQTAQIELAARIANIAGLKTVEGLRDSLTRYSKAIIEYVEQCRPYLAAPSPGANLDRGACVYYLGQFLIGSAGEEGLVKAFKGLPIDVPDSKELSMIAAQVMAKYNT
jgi:putative GTP pyrophosphokinase